ncbi:MAG: transposase [Rubripirellula sp.]
MSHQDKDDLRTPLAELKELLAPIEQVALGAIGRHGNAILDLHGIAILARLTFGWNQQQTLGDRFDDAPTATKRGFSGILLAGSFQALMVVLRACGDALARTISLHLLNHLSTQPNRLLFGRPTFAVDGSQFAVPRTAKNLAAFAAASRKAKSSYKKPADYAKAKTTQIAVSLCLHQGTGFPAFWNLGGSADSERGLLLDMLDLLPKNSRLVMDAYYFGFDFWNCLIDHGCTFVVRAGKSIDLLGQLSSPRESEVSWRSGLLLAAKCHRRGSLADRAELGVCDGWSQKDVPADERIDARGRPVGKAVCPAVGSGSFFRTVKQSYERAKMLSRTPENAKQEIQWTLLGIWMALTEGAQSIPAGRRISPVRVLRVICKLVTAVARHSSSKMNLHQQLEGCVIADESSRQSSKNSDHYPRKKRKRQTGEPNVHPISDELQKLAITRMT